MIDGMEEVKFEMASVTSDDQSPSQQQQLHDLTTSPTINKTSSEVRLTDEGFMEVIRDFPGVYDKNHEDFRDKTKKEECWEKISDVLNVRIEDTKRRYETIRTRLSRHLKRIKEGYWSIDSKDMKLDFLNWLVPYIKTRDAPFQFKQHDGTVVVKRDYSSMSFDDEHEGGEPPHNFVNNHCHRDEEHDDVTRVSMISIGGGESSGNKTDSSNSNHEDESNSSLPVVASITNVTPAGGEYTVEQTPNHVQHAIRKRKLVENHSANNTNYPTLQLQQQPPLPPPPSQHQKQFFYDRQQRVSPHHSRHADHYQSSQPQTAVLHSNSASLVNGSISSKGRDPKHQQQQEQLDEDEHYCMSLVRRMRKLDSKKKAYLRSTVEKLFLDFELGYVQFPKQPSYPAPLSQ